MRSRTPPRGRTPPPVRGRSPPPQSRSSLTRSPSGRRRSPPTRDRSSPRRAWSPGRSPYRYSSDGRPRSPYSRGRSPPRGRSPGRQRSPGRMPWPLPPPEYFAEYWERGSMPPLPPLPPEGWKYRRGEKSPTYRYKTAERRSPNYRWVNHFSYQVIYKSLFLIRFQYNF